MNRSSCLVGALLVVAAVFLSPGVRADFSLSGRSSVMAMNMTQAGREGLMVKGYRMRRDLTEQGRSYSYLYDLKSKEITLIDHLMRTAEVRTLASHARTAAGNLRFAIKPTGRQVPLGDWTCEEFTLSSSMPVVWGQETVTVVLEGQVWLDRKATERKELAPFMRAVENEDFFAGVPTPGRAVAPQVKVFNEVGRKLLGRGMVCAIDVQFKFEGKGPMADLARRTPTRVGMAYETQTDKDLPDSAFDIPAGYRIDRR